MNSLDVDDVQGLYELLPDRWFSRISTHVTNRARRIIYSTLGFGLSRVWRPRRLVLLTSLIHDINLIRGLVGEPEEVLSAHVWRGGMAQTSLTRFAFARLVGLSLGLFARLWVGVLG